ncbi:MAG: antibiotic biosynthesis monooxygenase [Myxococcota bacterium]
MILVTGVLDLQPGTRDAYLEASRPYIRAARAINGCTTFVVAADPIEENRVIVHELWRDRGALTAFRSSGPSDQLFSMIERVDIREMHVQDPASPERILAWLATSDLAHSEAFYTRFFGRPPDTRPMHGLVEWMYETSGGMQLFVSPEDAGHGCVTLLVQDVEHERARLQAAGLAPSAIQDGMANRFVQLHDPDGNRVVLHGSTSWKR